MKLVALALGIAACSSFSRSTQHIHVPLDYLLAVNDSSGTKRTFYATTDDTIDATYERDAELLVVEIVMKGDKHVFIDGDETMGNRQTVAFVRPAAWSIQPAPIKK